MILVILGVCIAIMIAAFFVCDFSSDTEGLGTIMGGVGFAGFIIAVIVGIVLLIDCIDANFIDERIELYQQENAKIEEQVADIVEQYQEHETGIFKEVAPDKSITVVSTYPELSSDTLVQSQIELYVANHQKIVELKAGLVTRSILRWWLYFGR